MFMWFNHIGIKIIAPERELMNYKFILFSCTIRTFYIILHE